MNRNSFIKIRVSGSELADIRAKAADAGMNVSDFMRLRTLNFRLRQSNNDRERIRQLARIGSNINQLARWANSYKLRAPALEVVLWLNRLIQEVNKTAEGE